MEHEILVNLEFSQSKLTHSKHPKAAELLQGPK